MVQDQPFTIGALARATGIKVETIRYYERINLLSAPPRTSGNYRSYTSDHFRRLSFIRRSRQLGFSIETLRALLDLADQKEADCSVVDIIAQEHLVEIERKIADLAALRRELKGFIGQCGNGTIAECRLIESLSPAPSRMRSAKKLKNG